MIRIETIHNLVSSKDWEGVTKLFHSLSNADFRRVETLVRTKLMPSLTNVDFWETYLFLLKFRRQAFVTCILSVENLAKHGDLDFCCKEAIEVARWMQEHAKDTVVKVVRMVVPCLKTTEQLEGLFHLFDYHDEHECAAMLLKEDTPHAYFVLFKVMKHAADNRPLLVSTCRAMMKKNDDLSFNMASLMRSYFGLDEIKSTFSLQIEPFELSYIDQSYDNFLHVIKGKRPKV